jgi:hypothetical protein
MSGMSLRDRFFSNVLSAAWAAVLGFRSFEALRAADGGIPVILSSTETDWLFPEALATLFLAPKAAARNGDEPSFCASDVCSFDLKASTS